MLMPFFFVSRSPRTRPPKDFLGISRRPSSTRKSRGSSRGAVVLSTDRLLQRRRHPRRARLAKPLVGTIGRNESAFAILHQTFRVWAMIETERVSQFMQNVLTQPAVDETLWCILTVETESRNYRAAVARKPHNSPIALASICSGNIACRKGDDLIAVDGQVVQVIKQAIRFVTFARRVIRVGRRGKRFVDNN